MGVTHDPASFISFRPTMLKITFLYFVSVLINIRLVNELKIVYFVFVGLVAMQYILGHDKRKSLGENDINNDEQEDTSESTTKIDTIDGEQQALISDEEDNANNELQHRARPSVGFEELPPLYHDDEMYIQTCLSFQRFLDRKNGCDTSLNKSIMFVEDLVKVREKLEELNECRYDDK
jgi:hypothetical protein